MLARVRMSRAVATLLLAALLLATGSAAARTIRKRSHVRNEPSAGNNKPLIGILTQPCEFCPGKSYVAAGYVKLVEMAGGRAVPVRFYESDAELYRIFKSINGLILPGGLTWLWLDAPYVIAARKLFNWAIQENDRGNPFPIHGTCLGHQLLHILASNISRNDLLVDTDSVAHPSTLEFTAEAATSKLFGTLPADLKQKLEDPTANIAIQNHMYGIPPAFYDRWPILKEWFSIITTSKDRNGTEYVSTMEARNYPFTGTQWHPEKPPFEFGMEEIPHTLESIQVSQHIANVFLETARKSQNKPESKEQELALQIYSTPMIFSARFEVFDDDNYDGPDQTYYFDQKDPYFPPHEPDDGPPEAEDKPKQQKKVATIKRMSHVDNRPRRIRTSKGMKLVSPRQMERLFT